MKQHSKTKLWVHSGCFQTTVCVCVNNRLLKKKELKCESPLSVTGTVQIFDLYGDGVIMVINFLRKKPNWPHVLAFSCSESTS